MAKIPVGAALSGQDEPDENAPLQDIIGGARNVASSANQSLLGDPASRSALLQIGLGLMQPSFQSTGGQIAQAVGGGGEAVGRLEKQQLEEEKVQDKLDIADARMKIAQQNANSLEQARQNRTLGGLTEALKYRMERDTTMDERRQTEQLDKDMRQDAKDKYEEVNSLVADETSPEVQKYKGKTKSQIYDIMKVEKGAKGGAPATAPAAGTAAPKAPTIKQGGFTYSLQPDGTYK